MGMQKWLLAGLATAATGASLAGDDWQTEADASGDAPLLSQAAAIPVRDEAATGAVTPVLFFTCGSGENAVIAGIDWQRFISSFSTEVGFKVDGGTFTWMKWKVDDSENVTLSPSAADTARLAALMASGGRLLVEVSPYSEAPVSTEFDLTGFTGALEALQERCR